MTEEQFELVENKANDLEDEELIELWNNNVAPWDEIHENNAETIQDLLGDLSPFEILELAFDSDYNTSDYYVRYSGDELKSNDDAFDLICDDYSYNEEFVIEILKLYDADELFEKFSEYFKNNIKDVDIDDIFMANFTNDSLCEMDWDELAEELEDIIEDQEESDEL